MIRCLFCGADATTCSYIPATEPERIAILDALVGKGFSCEALSSDRACVESLDMTSPGFVPWLREKMGKGGVDAV